MALKLKPNVNVLTLLNAIRTNHTLVETEYQKVSKEEFLAIPHPLEDIERDAEPKWGIGGYNEKYIVAAASLLKAKHITNSVIYPPMSMMGWHTNSDLEGYRTYYTYTEGEAIFRYVDENGNIQLDYDDLGWTCRTFKIQKEKPLWHSIWTEQKRYAFGFMT